MLWGKDGRCIGLTTSSPSYVDCLEIPEASKSCIPKDLAYIGRVLSFIVVSVSSFVFLAYIIWTMRWAERTARMRGKIPRDLMG